MRVFPCRGTRVVSIPAPSSECQGCHEQSWCWVSRALLQAHPLRVGVPALLGLAELAEQVEMSCLRCYAQSRCCGAQREHLKGDNTPTRALHQRLLPTQTQRSPSLPALVAMLKHNDLPHSHHPSRCSRLCGAGSANGPLVFIECAQPACFPNGMPGAPLGITVECLIN